jgi:hypothetical protein
VTVDVPPEAFPARVAAHDAHCAWQKKIHRLAAELEEIKSTKGPMRNKIMKGLLGNTEEGQRLMKYISKTASALSAPALKLLK